jgi:hypothetical protein
MEATERPLILLLHRKVIDLRVEVIGISDRENGRLF